MARDLELCVLCVRDTVTTASRWSWLACDACRTVSRDVGEAYGVRSILPLGRHSLMNGIGVRLADGELQVRRQTNAFLATVQRWDSLNAWQRAEFAWMAAPLRGRGPTVSLVEWQRRWPPSLGASVDVFERYAGSPVPDELTDLCQAREDFRSSAYLTARRQVAAAAPRCRSATSVLAWCRSTPAPLPPVERSHGQWIDRLVISELARLNRASERPLPCRARRRRRRTLTAAARRWLRRAPPVAPGRSCHRGQRI